MNIVQKAEQHVFEIFKNRVSDAHIYHNFLHTSRVFLASKLLADNLAIPSSDKEVLQLAAWFHDTGFSICDEQNESKGAAIARDFLSKENYPEDKITEVERLIMATCMTHLPTDLLEEIIKDADTSH